MPRHKLQIKSLQCIPQTLAREVERGGRWKERNDKDRVNKVRGTQNSNKQDIKGIRSGKRKREKGRVKEKERKRKSIRKNE